ncbi:hypothetical protein E2C01_091535 [Portunus trituberculatus]|uniref:Uncharacterized protein n=1 Tax=Portunus trituberculatus TaxID=210409 RepID=A0A5B7JNV1_PORTR|nr:hypothetical protein [Portunus trituberculatus]
MFDPRQELSSHAKSVRRSIVSTGQVDSGRASCPCCYPAWPAAAAACCLLPGLPHLTSPPAAPHLTSTTPITPWPPAGVLYSPVPVPVPTLSPLAPRPAGRVLYCLSSLRPSLLTLASCLPRR